MEIEIFTDETYIVDNFGKKYIGICSLFVPTSFKEELVRKLWNLRCLSPYSTSWNHKFDKCNNIKCKEYYHDLNNFEIHFKDIQKSTSKSKLKIYENWINFLVNHNKEISDRNKLIYFKILFLDLDKLELNRFGLSKNTEDKNNIYNRFYKSMILGAKNFFFKDSNLTIKEFFHDISDDKESHDYFSYHTPIKLNEYRDCNVINDEITFIESNHKNQEGVLKDNAQLIQFADLILGCSRYLLFNKSFNENKELIASKFYPLFERIWNNPKNFNSKFNYYRSQEASIFPKNKIEKQKDLWGYLREIDGQYHHDIKLIEPKFNSKNESLDKWFL